jgi:GTPase SAR1 family protein
MPALCGGSKTVQRKLVLLGDGASGKTSLLNVFTRGYARELLRINLSRKQGDQPNPR